MQERCIADRAMLQQLIQKHPEWTQQELANWIGRSLGWVKKWVKRLREAPPGDTSVLFGKPFGRKTPYPQTDPTVEARILAIRDTPPENLKRTPGPQAILYYLSRDPSLQQYPEVLPRSTRTIWKILRRNDRITQEKHRKRKPPKPLRALEEIQMDFKDITTVPKAETGKQQHVVEALNFMDAGSSILLDAQVQADFHAQTTLQAVVGFLQRYGLPPKITFDRDPRLVGAATGRDFPSPRVRFLLCLGVTPNVCPPHRPDKNAFVERYHRTYNQECIQVYCPHTLEQAREITEAFVIHYNTERPNQALSCRNQPPRVAFPELSSLPPLPQFVDPDAWLPHVHGKHFIRKVRQNGTVRIAEGSYYVHLDMIGQYVDLGVDAYQQVFVIRRKSQVLKQVPIKGLQHTLLSFEEFATLMCTLALSEQRRRLASPTKGLSYAVISEPAYPLSWMPPPGKACGIFCMFTVKSHKRFLCLRSRFLPLLWVFRAEYAAEKCPVLLFSLICLLASLRLAETGRVTRIESHTPGDSLRRSYKICQALCKKASKPLGKEKKMALLHFRAPS